MQFDTDLTGESVDSDMPVHRSVSHDDLSSSYWLTHELEQLNKGLDRIEKSVEAIARACQQIAQAAAVFIGVVEGLVLALKIVMYGAAIYTVLSWLFEGLGFQGIAILGFASWFSWSVFSSLRSVYRRWRAKKHGPAYPATAAPPA